MQLKAQTKTHPSGSQSGRSAAIPLRSRRQTTPPRHPLPHSAQHLRALGPPAPAPTPARAAAPAPTPTHKPSTAPALRARQLPGLRAAAPAPRPARCPAPARWLARSRVLARPLPRSGLRERLREREVPRSI